MKSVIIVLLAVISATTIPASAITPTRPIATSPTTATACTKNPSLCKNNGTCRDLPGGKYRCDCPRLWTGDHCEKVNHCAANPCQNGGKCVSLDDVYVCSCTSGRWSGQNCTQENYCASQPCKNGGSCTSYADSFACDCMPGIWAGADCTLDIENNCEGNPCQNGGWCKDGMYKPVCTCASGWTGDVCDIARNTTTTMVPSFTDVKIDASPSAIHELFTKHLVVNCSFSPGVASQVNTIMSLILAKTSNASSDEYSELISITAFSGGKEQMFNSLGAEINSHLDVNGESFISMRWMYPGNHVTGKYKCEVHGIDQRGHAIDSFVTTVITERVVNLDLVLEKMKFLDSTLDNLSAFQFMTTSRLENSKDVMLEAEVDFMGHKYFLSKPLMRNVAVAHSICRLNGAYLVEINNQPEFNFLTKFLTDHFNVTKAGVKNIAIGAKDEGHEGTWLYLRSGAHVHFFDWAAGEPNGGYTESCMELDLTGSDDFKMFDRPCSALSMHRFMCESVIV